MRALGALSTWARMVKLPHSIFALPFALSGAALAAMRYAFTGRDLLWIVVAMFCARNAAMGFNRLADHEIDARNPRTASRELPRGILSRRAVWLFTLALSGLFVVASFMLKPICGWLSPLALLIVFGYSFTKRFTSASHFFLGLALAIAPVGGWLAIAGKFALLPWVLGASVLVWVAGFDVIYACQDRDFDVSEGLHSVPARFGIAGALWLARLLHLGALAGLTVVGWLAGLNVAYWIGLAAIGLLLVWEHRLVRPDDLSRLGAAFFNMNGIISVLYFLLILASGWLTPPAP